MTTTADVSGTAPILIFIEFNGRRLSRARDGATNEGTTA